MSHVQNQAAVPGEELKPKATHEEHIPGEVAPFVPNPALERRILRKVDTRILPTLWVMYWLNYLDRNNIGNAKEAGLSSDLGLSSSDYSLAVSLFFIGYVVLQIPSNMILTRVRPRLYLPAIEFVWGCMVIAYVGVNNKSGLYAIRLFLGVVEAGFFPGALLYMSLWYKKHELARRYAIFYSASQLAGAFGGLLAGAILSGLGGRNGLPAWKWLFIIEGLMTVGFSGAAVLILPDWPSNTKWLTQEERDYAVARIQAEKDTDSAGDKPVSHWRAFVLAVTDWRVWLVLLGQNMATAGGTITYFIPTLTVALGYSGKMAQYMTVPIYCVSLVFVIFTAFTSDYSKDREWHLVGLSLFAVMCLAIVAGVHDAHVRYAFLALGWGGIQSCVLLNFAYMGNSFGRPAEKRAVAIGLINGIANLASIYGSYIWPAYTAPQYIPGFAATCGFMFVLTLCALAYKFIIPRFPETYTPRN